MGKESGGQGEKERRVSKLENISTGISPPLF